MYSSELKKKKKLIQKKNKQKKTKINVFGLRQPSSDELND